LGKNKLSYEEFETRIRQLESEIDTLRQPAKNLKFFKNLDRINEVIIKASDIQQLLDDVIKTVHEIFGSDRCWLFYPCDPEAPSFRIEIEHCKPEHPGGLVLGLDIPMIPEAARAIQIALDAEDPVRFDPQSGIELDNIAKEYFVQSQMIIPVYPKIGKPWMFGMHQCSYARVWTDEEQRLFKVISRRIADALSNLLLHKEKEELIAKLQDALSEIKTLRGIIPICMHCKNIRDDKGYWTRVDTYVTKHTDAKFTHGVCPQCANKYYTDMNLYPEENGT
jgi:transcriptional regulator with GAF, ATPase, and Fis domain